jgi:carboxyl-terminal processing protease
MNNAHTVFVDQNEIRQGGGLPFSAQLLNGKWVVTESWTAGLKTGDTIDSIDGKPFGRFVQEALKFVSGSTEEGRRRLLFVRLPGMSPYAQLFPDQFALTLAGGKTVQVDRGDLAEADQMHTQGRWIEEGKIAYIRIPSFMGASFEKMALDLAAEYKDAPALIVDVRGNAGGSTPEKLTAFLMDRPYHWWTEEVPVNVPFLQMKEAQGHDDYSMFRHSSMQWASGAKQPEKEHFGRTLVLLADAGCMSACEDFVMPFKDSYRALIVGETTSGSSGQPYTMDLGNGIMVMIGAKRESFPDGAQFEGIGIKPDTDVSPTVEDLKAGKDTALQAAVRSLARTAR